MAYLQWTIKLQPLLQYFFVVLVKKEPLDYDLQTTVETGLWSGRRRH